MDTNITKKHQIISQFFPIFRFKEMDEISLSSYDRIDFCCRNTLPGLRLLYALLQTDIIPREILNIILKYFSKSNKFRKIFHQYRWNKCISVSPCLCNYKTNKNMFRPRIHEGIALDLLKCCIGCEFEVKSLVKVHAICINGNIPSYRCIKRIRIGAFSHVHNLQYIYEFNKCEDQVRRISVPYWDNIDTNVFIFDPNVRKNHHKYYGMQNNFMLLEPNIIYRLGLMDKNVVYLNEPLICNNKVNIINNQNNPIKRIKWEYFNIDLSPINDNTKHRLHWFPNIKLIQHSNEYIF